MSSEDPTDEEVVQTASDAAEGYVFTQYKQSDVRDLDVTASFDDGMLEVDVYLNAPDGEETPNPETVADDAALAARDAVDDLFGE
ncbi:DUF3194 domain-containing protein [Natronorubrum daqingense]|uniref:DUF3194 domain-containing protein n=1 Tax=Natronorubrum daqingense TaxID=588898 RepID=A0A1N6Y4R6_9EURY|nr:DUF3194 domain-containing protein [Natronorubrum daqingense]APX95782.1 DUF3194 domain-containing protein [Natronorubrum daqingense]SIR09570.1 Protein of unknown function [Natronorubrum daqingense]